MAEPFQVIVGIEPGRALADAPPQLWNLLGIVLNEEQQQQALRSHQTTVPLSQEEADDLEHILRRVQSQPFLVALAAQFGLTATIQPLLPGDVPGPAVYTFGDPASHSDHVGTPQPTAGCDPATANAKTDPFAEK